MSQKRAFKCHSAPFWFSVIPSQLELELSGLSESVSLLYNRCHVGEWMAVISIDQHRSIRVERLVPIYKQ